MKKIMLVIAALSLVAGCAKNELRENPVTTPDAANGGAVSFVAGFQKTDTRISTEAGESTWQSGDAITVFSAETGAAAGVSVGTNVQYQADSDGASTTFTKVSAEITPGDTYYAFFPYEATYASNLNAAGGISFAGVSKDDPVADYRFVPININSSATVTVDPATGEGVSDVGPFFYASADTPADPADPVALTFRPVLPMLQFDLYGHGTVKSMEVAFTDKTTDAYAEGNWLTAKGVIDLSTGAFTTTNYSGSAYYKLAVTIKEQAPGNNYVTLDDVNPIKVKVTTGHFNITKGLTLTFKDKDANSFSKSIWASGMSSKKAGVTRHIRQGIIVPYVTASVASVAEFPSAGGDASAFTVSTSSSWSVSSKPGWISLDTTSGTGGESVTATAAANDGAARDGEIVLVSAEGAVCSIAVSQAAFAVLAADWHRVDISALTFSESTSYIYDVRNSSSQLVARITKEFLGSTVNKQAIVVYPCPSGTPDYTDGHVAQVTRDGGGAPVSDIHGGTVNANTMTPGSVVYSAGTSAALTTVWVKSDGSEIQFTTPSGSISAGGVSPYVLTSAIDIDHALVKIGSQIWTGTGYKTTKFANGTNIDSIVGPTGAVSTTEPTVAVDGDKYLYNAPAISSGFAPSGWSLPTRTQWTTDLAGFLGGTASYDNLGSNGAMLFTRVCYKKPSASAPASLGYYNTWSCNSKDASNWYMLLCKSATAPGESAQGNKSMFEIRLLKN